MSDSVRVSPASVLDSVNADRATFTSRVTTYPTPEEVIRQAKRSTEPGTRARAS